MIDFCILGSGIAGSTIANLLSKKYTVHVFDKARGPGGRASNKRFIGNLSFDHGVQYISPDTKQFKKFINQLYKKSLLKVWSGNHIDFTFEKKEIKNKFIGKKGNNVISKYNLKNIKKNYHSQIKKITFKNNCWILKLINNDIVKTKSLILTCPFPQLKTLAKNYLTKKILNLKINMEPNITVMIVIKNQKQIPVSSIKFNDDILAWAAFENSKKRFKSSNALWTLQSTTKWARKKIKNFKENKEIELNLISRFLKLTGYKKKDLIFKRTHGWKYSYNLNKTPMKSYWDQKYRLGICADWFIGPKVESAWLSANDLAKKIK